MVQVIHDKHQITLNQKTSSKVLIENVVMMKAYINYTVLYMQDGSTNLVTRTIKFFEQSLESHGFIRIHRSYIINPKYIKGVSPEGDILLMSNGQEVIISRRKKGIMKGLMA
jgi:DNA-binding LytR/AlgR family response regulator